MKTIAPVCFCLVRFSTYCSAQLSVNPDWRQQNGLTVASSQTVPVTAKFLRGFTTLESTNAEAADAIAKVAAQKKAAIDALKAVVATEKSIKTTSTRILEYDETPKAWRTNRSDTVALSPRTESDETTAVAYLSFDIPLGARDSDALALLPYDTCKRLRKQAVFESNKIYFLFVGELSES